MKISHKMVLVFSVVVLVITITNAIYLTQTNINRMDSSTAEQYVTIADNIVSSLENYIRLMDLAIEDLTGDTSFMEAFYQVISSSEDEDTLSWQNTMFQILYHSPVCESFYRVSIYSDNGFYLSNTVDRNSTLQSMSDEAVEVIQNIPYRKAVKAAPYRHHVIAPHMDHFNVARQVNVFSVVHAVTWHGEFIGYVEVSALTDDLSDIMLSEAGGLMTRATFQDGSILYASPEDEAVYENVPVGEFMFYTDPTGLERNVYHTESRWLDLDVYLAQDASVRVAQVHEMTREYVARSLLIFLISVAVIALLSSQLTSSLLRLSEKVRTMPVDRLITESGGLTTYVTSPHQREAYTLETAFNNLMVALRKTTISELNSRESALRARLKALQTQINPHFVYNTLNVIAAKGMESGNEDVVNLCDQFAQMLRYSTDTRTETVTLREDLQHVRNYLLLQKARYEDRLEYEITMPEELESLPIPRLTLQPLVENSISHGYEGLAVVRRISISGSLTDGLACLTIRDNGNGFAPDVLARLQESIDTVEHEEGAPDTGGHIGLVNTCLRLHYYSRGKIRVRLENDHGAVVQILVQRETTA